MADRVLVVGIEASGPDADALAALAGAEVVVGSPRQLDLLPDDVRARREPWGRPLRDSIRPILDAARGERVVVVASGDPLMHGVATTLIDVLGADAVEVLPATSSVTLARARLGWSAETTTVVRDDRELPRLLVPGARVLILSADAGVPAAIARRLVDVGFGASSVTVLSDLGTEDELVRSATADTWEDSSPALNVVAVQVAGSGRALPLVGGLPDDAFEHDGQLTKRDVRAAALARLAPLPGQHLWDVGAGAGSVGIEWARAAPRASVSAIERDADRAERIGRNSERLGTSRVDVVEGRAPDALRDLPRPDAVFIGGGATRDGVIDSCWAALDVGGRLVVHAVTLETEAELARRHADLGGELVRLAVEHAEPIGTFRGWTPARAVVQWSVVKGEQG